jgi:hypothetical protein
MTAGDANPAELTSAGGAGPIVAAGYRTGDGPTGALPGPPASSHTIRNNIVHIG